MNCRKLNTKSVDILFFEFIMYNFALTQITHGNEYIINKTSSTRASLRENINQNLDTLITHLHSKLIVSIRI